jgi:hypothetical protein
MHRLPFVQLGVPQVPGEAVAMPFSFSRADATLLDGVIDMHLHTMPCLFDRPLDDIDAAEQAREAGYRGLVLKSIYSPNADRVELVRRVVPGIELFGTLVLNHSVGGLNPEAVRTAIGFGAKVMWLPTVHAQHHFDHFGMPTYPWLGQRVGALPQAAVPGIRLLDSEGRLKPEVCEILALAKAADLVTGTGHIGLDEVYAVAREARRIGYEKLVQTHVGWHATDWPLDDLRALADLGMRFEFCINPTMPNRQQQSPRKLTDTIKALGVERCFIATDLGQHDNAHPIEGMRMWLRILALHGFSASEIDHLARRHPAALLDLPPRDAPPAA